MKANIPAIQSMSLPLRMVTTQSVVRNTAGF